MKKYKYKQYNKYIYILYIYIQTKMHMYAQTFGHAIPIWSWISFWVLKERLRRICLIIFNETLWLND